MNINRDYLIINDVKKSNVKLDNGSMFFYITDKNTQNIFVNLVINISNNDLIQKYANIENAEDYTLTMNIVKPSNTYKIVEGKLHDKEKAIFEFNLNEDCCDEIGPYRCELLTKCNINGHEEITTSNKLTYKVKSSVLNDLDDIVEAPEYPLVIQLFDKLSDIEQYEEDRRTNELARQLAEEQRQARFNTLDADMTDRITTMDNKMVDVENRVSTKEQAVDKLINDTKSDIDDYKVAKDQEIDEYKIAKDTEINNAITTQDNKINEFINERNNRLDTIEAKNTEQDNRLDITENRLANIGNDITNTMQPIIDGHTSRLEAIEAIDVAQNNRLDVIEAKNQQQDDRLLDIEKVNNRQDIDIKCLYGASQTIDVTKEGNSIYLQNSNNGFTIVDEIKGNTLVNCNKEPDKELILNGNINTSGDNTVTITEGVDGGLVDVALEGNTLVNVCDQKDPVAITKSYTVETGNHIALQGEYDGKCRPVVTGNTSVNLINNGLVTYVNHTSNYYVYRCNFTSNSFKSSTTYTIIFNSEIEGVYLHPLTGLYGYKSISNNRYVFTTKAESISNNIEINFRNPTEVIAEDVKIIILEGDYTDKPIPDYFEGLQSSFEDNLVTQEMVDNGEEVADNLGKYRVDYNVTGKNKFDSNTMKSKWWVQGDGVIKNDLNIFYSVLVPIKNNCSYTLSCNANLDRRFYALLDSDYNDIFICAQATDTIINNIGAKYLLWYLNSTGITDDYNIQIEEGDVSTVYEPYKRYTKTLYLNSPLLEGDTIEEKDGGVYHVHRSELVEYTEGDETSLITDRVHTLHQLASPQYELIEQSNLEIPSYANGHLDFSTAVPVKKVEFKPFSEELTYLYANTQYTIQFVSDKATTADITLGGTQLLSQSIVAGLNRISITTPATLVDNKLIINGAGAKISEVVVTDTNREFKYFEGMKSVGECEELEVKSNNKNLMDEGYRDFNKTTLDGYRGYRFKLNPNKKYTIKLKLKEDKILPEHTWITLTLYCDPNKLEAYYVHLINDSEVSAFYEYSTVYSDLASVMDKNGYVWLSVYSNGQQALKSVYDSVIECIDYIQIEEGSTATDYIPHQHNTQQLTHEPLRAVGDVKDRYVLLDGNWYIERNCGINNIKDYTVVNTDNVKRVVINFNNHKTNSLCICDSIKSDKPGISGTFFINPDNIVVVFDKNDTITDEDMITKVSQYNFIYQLATPAYEPINYNPLEVYSGTTHITTNSTIPCNIVVKNHGFNCLLKPSTTYTISSNLGLNTVTTPSTLTEDCLRFMDTDTSDVTTMRDVLVLEGDWTSKADLIPANFSGMESAFEQEYDVEKGKYKVNVKVANEDKSKENNITFYINEPLRGIGDVKDRIYVKDDRMVVERNCIVKTVDGSENDWSLKKDNGNSLTFLLGKNLFADAYSNPPCICNLFTQDMAQGLIKADNSMRITEYSGKQRLYLVPTKEKCSDLQSFKQWLQQNPTTVVYQLAEPTYEEVKYNDTKLFIESFKNSTLSYNSNVPVTSKLYYSYSVPIVDTVAKTASITDEQDSMIIDLATQCAVMEMMLM